MGTGIKKLIINGEKFQLTSDGCLHSIIILIIYVILKYAPVTCTEVNFLQSQSSLVF